MSNLYVVTYLTPDYKLLLQMQRTGTCNSSLGAAFAQAVQSGCWPYDGGDDPSFFSWQQHRDQDGALTWGVCRPDVRGRIQPGDVVAFFSYLRHSLANADYMQGTYLFVGFATVQDKLSQADIWGKLTLEGKPPHILYQLYLNHLIAPEGSGYKHSEPVPGQDHSDWLWRVADCKGHQKNSENACWEWRAPQSDYFSPGTMCTDNKPICFGKNYVLLDSNPYETYILREPVPVAKYKDNCGPSEEWFQSEVAQGVRQRTLCRAAGPRRALRTSNLQQPHRHIRVACDTAKWKLDMALFLEKQHLQCL